MKPILLTILVALTSLGCNSPKQEVFEPKEIYRSDDLVITQVSGNAFEHISYLQTEEWGKVPCNGLVVRDGNETLVFDTPTNDKSTQELIRWIADSLHCKINAVIPTHFHNDCLGGLKPFHEGGVPSYASARTVELAKENDYTVPQNSFSDSLILKVGKENIVAKFFGEGYTKDNVVGYFPAEEVMFGGCLIKELGAGKGYLGDANVSHWSATVEKVKQAYPGVKIIVPGHGKYGDHRLLDYTIGLFKNP